MRIVDSVWRLHPSETDWVNLAANLIDGPEAGRLLAHAAKCDSCARRLKETSFLLQQDEESSPEFEIEFESRIPALAASLAERVTKPRIFATPGTWLAAHVRKPQTIAAVGALAAALVLFVALPEKPPLSNLAAAYTAQRTVELRIPGAAYGQMRVARSSGLADTSSELLETQAKIQRHLDRRPTDTGWLHARGRAQLLVWQYDAAIENFQAASAGNAESPEFWIDFATAYFQRAEVRGNADDYRKAIELLDRALQHRPREPAALFNRALVYAKLARTGEAIRDLELCLEAENDQGWKEEARARLHEIRQ